MDLRRIGALKLLGVTSDGMLSFVEKDVRQTGSI